MTLYPELTLIAWKRDGGYYVRSYLGSARHAGGDNRRRRQLIGDRASPGAKHNRSTGISVTAVTTLFLG